MKKLYCMLAALLTFLTLVLPALAADFSASGLSVSGSAQQLGKASDYGSGKITVSVPGENPILSGESPLTGEPYSGSHQLVLANIDTHPRALPHWGVASADIIYELPIQADGSTRSLALFLTEHPNSAGPIRSARVPMASLREMWGGTYCFYGYQGGRDKNNVKDWVTSNSAERRFAYPYYLNGMTKNSKWFPRSSDQNHVAPYNVRLDMHALLDGGTAEANIHPFRFADAPLTRGEAVNGLVISYKATNPAYVSAYQYNAATGLYERFRNGTPYLDANTGEACAYANVIVLRTDISWASSNPSRPVIRLHGEGVCEIFQNGRYIRGTWARESTETKNLQNRMVFLDENGEELSMQRGKTFIQIVDNGQPVVVLADENIEGSVEPQEQRLTIGSGSVKSSKPRATRTPRPTRTPEPTSTPEPSDAPTETPTDAPTDAPTDTPSDIPTDVPDSDPIVPPSDESGSTPDDTPSAPPADDQPETGAQPKPDAPETPDHAGGEQEKDDSGSTEAIVPDAKPEDTAPQPEEAPAVKEEESAKEQAPDKESNKQSEPSAEKPEEPPAEKPEEKAESAGGDAQAQHADEPVEAPAPVSEISADASSANGEAAAEETAE